MVYGSGIVAFEWSSVGLSLLFVLLRVYVGVFYPEGKHDWRDYIVLVAWLNFVACCVCDAELRRLGFMGPKITYRGDPTHVNSDPEKNIEILKIIYASTFPYIIDLWLIKAGILTFYYTIVPKTCLVYRLFLHIIAVFSVITFVLVFCGSVFWCSPIKRNWSLNKEELCIASARLPPFSGTASSTIATDLMIFCFPLPLLRTVNLPRRKLGGLIFVFVMGFLTIFAAVCRVIAISTSAAVSTVSAWSALECSTGIMVACIPALNVLVLRRESPSRPSHKKSYPGRLGPSVLSAADRNEIWDGSDATAPQWIRMASISGPGGNPGMSPTTAKFDDLVDSALSRQLSQSYSADYVSSDFSMVTAVPNIRLKIGRGIVEHAYMPPTSPAPAYGQFGGGGGGGNSLLSTSLLSPSLLSPSSVAGGADGLGSDFRPNESDDTLPWVLNRCDTGESGRRIMDITAGVNRPKSTLPPEYGKGECSS